MENSSNEKLLKIIHGHDSFEKAFKAENYPYGYRLKTTMNYWIETTNKGQRLCTQSINPKNGRLNAVKKSTYSDCKFLALDENNHIVTISFNMNYSSVESFKKLLDKYKNQLQEDEVLKLEKMLSIKEKRENLMDKIMEDVKKENLNKLDNNLIEENTIILKDQIPKYKDSMNLYDVSISGKAIKKRCRNSDYHTLRLGYIKKENFNLDLFLEKYKNDLKSLLSNNIKEVINMNIEFRNVSYEPSANDSIFYSMKQNLFDDRNFKLELKVLE